MKAIDSPETVALYGTAWLAFACWASFHWMPDSSSSRLFWTIGAAANLAHVLLALQIVYAWDQHLAFTAIARQTYEQTGLDSGVGLYINYAFSGLWVADALSWWLFPWRYVRRSRWLDCVLQFLFLFMFFNATVVFGKSFIRILGTIVCPLGAIGWFHPTRTAE
jgi:hypothetical protein